jgi:hypothetical protein
VYYYLVAMPGTKAQWDSKWENSAHPTHRVYVAPWCPHCATFMKDLLRRGTKKGVVLNLYVHGDVPGDFHASGANFPDRNAYDAVPAVFTVQPNDPNGPGAPVANGDPRNLLAPTEAFRAAIFTRSLFQDRWVRASVVIIALTFALRRLHL